MTDTSTLSRRALVSRLLAACIVVAFALDSRAARAEDEAPAAGFRPATRVSIDYGFWEINGKTTYPGTLAEGLLMNVRAVNATFEDRNEKTCPEGFDPDANTDAFLSAVPSYMEHGVNAFTLCLQGGMPGYEGALNSAYEKDGSLRADYLARVARVIEALDARGAAVILGCFYQRQDQVLADEAAVKKAVTETAKWIREKGYTNVLLEVANEFPHGGFDHEIIQTPGGCASLIRLAKEAHPELLVSASGLGDGRVEAEIMSAADYLLLHFNSTPVGRIGRLVGAAGKVSKAVVCNEDDKTGEAGAKACEETVKNLCSWGYMNKEKNQYHPFEFEGAKDDPIVYAKIREVTTGK